MILLVSLVGTWGDQVVVDMTVCQQTEGLWKRTDRVGGRIKGQAFVQKVVGSIR